MEGDLVLLPLTFPRIEAYYCRELVESFERCLICGGMQLQWNFKSCLKNVPRLDAPRRAEAKHPFGFIVSFRSTCSCLLCGQHMLNWLSNT
eukprot:4812405-Amphidinium_carterae.1